MTKPFKPHINGMTPQEYRALLLTIPLPGDELAGSGLPAVGGRLPAAPASTTPEPARKPEPPAPPVTPGSPLYCQVHKSHLGILLPAFGAVGITYLSAQMVKVVANKLGKSYLLSSDIRTVSGLSASDNSRALAKLAKLGLVKRAGVGKWRLAKLPTDEKTRLADVPTMDGRCAN